jgi:hypothetical protein
MKHVLRHFFICGLASACLLPSVGQAAGFKFDRALLETISHANDNLNRCTDDQLPNDGNASADARVKWANDCGLVRASKAFTHYLDANDEWQPASVHRYPIFAHNQAPGYPVWKPNYSSCAIPADVVWYTICAPGCYEPTQRVLFADGYTGIKAAKDAAKDVLVTLAPDATFEALTFKTQKVQRYTESRVAAKERMIRFQLASGGALMITVEHPMVDQTGTLRNAKTFKVGDSFVKVDGTLDPITKIEEKDYFGKVYNVAPKSSEGIENIVVAEGYLSGSHKFQASDVSNFERYKERPVIPSRLIEQ